MNATSIARALLAYALLSLCFISPAQAQTSKDSLENGQILSQEQKPELKKQLSPEELEVFKVETEKKVRQLQVQMGKIASRSESLASKMIYKKQTLRIFINNGEGRTIEVSSMNNDRVKEYEIPVYLERLANLTHYATVIMRSASSCLISDYHEAGLDANGNQIYEATATIYQEFIALNNDGSVIYQDYTTKTFAIQLRQVQSVISENGWRWAALLGDIKVSGTFPEKQ